MARHYAVFRNNRFVGGITTAAHPTDRAFVRALKQAKYLPASAVIEDMDGDPGEAYGFVLRFSVGGGRSQLVVRNDEGLANMRGHSSGSEAKSPRISKSYREHVTCRDPNCGVPEGARCHDCGKKMRSHVHCFQGRNELVTCVPCAARSGAC